MKKCIADIVVLARNNMNTTQTEQVMQLKSTNSHSWMGIGTALFTEKVSVSVGLEL